MGEYCGCEKNEMERENVCLVAERMKSKEYVKVPGYN